MFLQTAQKCSQVKHTAGQIEGMSSSEGSRYRHVYACIKVLLVADRLLKNAQVKHAAGH